MDKLFNFLVNVFIYLYSSDLNLFQKTVIDTEVIFQLSSNIQIPILYHLIHFHNFLNSSLLQIFHLQFFCRIFYECR